MSLIARNKPQYKAIGGLINSVFGLTAAPDLSGNDKESFDTIAGMLEKWGIPDPSLEDVLAFLTDPKRFILTTPTTNTKSTSLETPVDSGPDSSRLQIDDGGYFDVDKGVRMIPDGEGGVRERTDADTGGWNFRGKPQEEFEKDHDAFLEKRDRQKFMTDAERELDDDGLSDDYEELIGISSPDDIKAAKEIADALEDFKKGNMSPKEIVQDILDSVDHKNMTFGGLARAVEHFTGKSLGEVLELIS